MEKELGTSDRKSEETKGIRHLMTTFWKEHSINGDLTEMLLDSNAQTISAIELDEILHMLPDYCGKSVLELGAGIGRFTTQLAKKAKSVVAVDFMESFIQKNAITNGHLQNVQFICLNVLALLFPDNRFDMVFSNWLLMYLSDEEIRTLISSLLLWLKPGGTLFFRESCKCQSGNAKRNFNPTQYRDSKKYVALFNKTTVTKNGKTYGFRIIKSKSVQAYIKLKDNKNQICWLLKSESRDVDYSYSTAVSMVRRSYLNRNYFRKWILIYTSTASLGSDNVTPRTHKGKQILVARRAEIDRTLNLIDVFRKVLSDVAFTKLLRSGFKQEHSEDKIDVLLKVLRERLKITD